MLEKAQQEYHTAFRKRVDSAAAEGRPAAAPKAASSGASTKDNSSDDSDGAESEESDPAVLRARIAELQEEVEALRLRNALLERKVDGMGKA